MMAFCINDLATMDPEGIGFQGNNDVAFVSVGENSNSSQFKEIRFTNTEITGYFHIPYRKSLILSEQGVRNSVTSKSQFLPQLRGPAQKTHYTSGSSFPPSFCQFCLFLTLFLFYFY